MNTRCERGKMNKGAMKGREVEKYGEGEAENARIYSSI